MSAHIRSRSPRPRAVALSLIIAGATLAPVLAYAQGPPDPPGPLSLDAAVNAQLEFLNVACERLANGDLAQRDQLQGQLSVICHRGIPAGDTGTSSAAGNGAATGAASMPEAVRRRLGDDESLGEAKPVRGAFGTVSWGSSNRDITNFQDGYQGDVSGLLGGFDREFGKWVAGFTVEYWQQKGDFIGGGNFETTSVGPTIYASRALNDKAEIAFYAGSNSIDNDRVRAARFTHVLPDGTEVIPTQNGRPIAKFDADDLLAGGQFTYRIASGNLALVPKVALDWKRTDFDGFRETETTDSGLALAFYDDSRTSLIATVGIDASVSISTSFGVVVVAEHLNYKRELDDDQRSVSVSFVDDPRNQRFQFQTEPPDRAYLQVGIDTVFLLQGGFQFFVGYEQLSSHRYLETGVLSAGIRKEF